MQRSYIIGDDVLAQCDSTGVQQLMADGHGSTRFLTDSSGGGNPIGDYRYDAFGQARNFDATSAGTRLLYTGQQFDPGDTAPGGGGGGTNIAFSQYYLRARYYDPAVGRFNRMDPFAGSHSDPQSLHKYAYCHGDPVNGWDPSGMFSMSMSSLMTAISIGTFVMGAVVLGIGKYKQSYTLTAIGMSLMVLGASLGIVATLLAIGLITSAATALLSAFAVLIGEVLLTYGYNVAKSKAIMANDYGFMKYFLIDANANGNRSNSDGKLYLRKMGKFVFSDSSNVTYKTLWDESVEPKLFLGPPRNPSLEYGNVIVGYEVIHSGGLDGHSYTIIISRYRVDGQGNEILQFSETHTFDFGDIYLHPGGMTRYVDYR